MSTTYELIAAARFLVTELLDSAGEVTPDIEAALNYYNAETPDKLAALRAASRAIKSEKEFLTKEIAHLTARKNALSKGEARVKELGTDLLKANLELTGESKIKTSTFTAYLGKSTAVSVPDDIRYLAPELKVFSERADKSAIKLALQNGQTVRGCELVETQSVRFR